MLAHTQMCAQCSSSHKCSIKHKGPMATSTQAASVQCAVQEVSDKSLVGTRMIAISGQAGRLAAGVALPPRRCQRMKLTRAPGHRNAPPPPLASPAWHDALCGKARMAVPTGTAKNMCQDELSEKKHGIPLGPASIRPSGCAV